MANQLPLDLATDWIALNPEPVRNYSQKIREEMKG